MEQEDGTVRMVITYAEDGKTTEMQFDKDGDQMTDD